jgi:hypothetical protein
MAKKTTLTKKQVLELETVLEGIAAALQHAKSEKTAVGKAKEDTEILLKNFQSGDCGCYRCPEASVTKSAKATKSTKTAKAAKATKKAKK